MGHHVQRVDKLGGARAIGVVMLAVVLLFLAAAFLL